MSAEARHWGLAALGRHGDIAVDLDEPIDHDDPWHLQVSGRGWEFVFDVTGPESVRALHAFARDHHGRRTLAELPIGHFSQAQVMLVKDVEFADRFRLRLRGPHTTAEVTIAGDDARSLLRALADLVADLGAP